MLLLYSWKIQTSVVAVNKANKKYSKNISIKFNVQALVQRKI